MERTSDTFLSKEVGRNEANRLVHRQGVLPPERQGSTHQPQTVPFNSEVLRRFFSEQDMVISGLIANL